MGLYYNRRKAFRGSADPASSLLLHCDGTNGSTTFTDDQTAGSVNTVVANGDAQITTTTPKFGTGALLCDDTGDYLSIASPNFNFSSDDFTIDFWLNNINTTNEGLFEIPFTDESLPGTQSRFECYINSNGDFTFEFRKAGSGSPIVLQESVNFGSGSYSHIAITRDSSTWRYFKDGVLLESDTSSESVPDIDYIDIGRVDKYSMLLNGRIDEFRVVIGTAVWTANFTPPTSPYTA